MSFSFRLVSGRSVIGSGVASVLGKLPNLQASAGFRSAELLLRIDHPFRSPERDEEGGERVGIGEQWFTRRRTVS
jgi:hypothetical protein